MALDPQQRTKDMAATRTGFDILAEKILGLNNENNSSLRTSLLSNDRALTAAVATAARRVKSLKQRMGKRKTDVAVVMSTPQSKRIRFTHNMITPQSSWVSTDSSMPQSSSTQMSTPRSAPPRPPPTNTSQSRRLHSDLSADLFNRPQAIVINQDIVPLHCVHPPSALQPVYKQLLPHDIVRLAAGKDLIIVIPAIQVVKQINSVRAIRQFYTGKFCCIIEKTCGRINPVDRASLAEEALVKHALPRDDATILQFCVRVVNYPEQCHFESEAIHSQQVDMYWN
jgi:hypothetical protein